MFGRQTVVLCAIALSACPAKPKQDLCLPAGSPQGMTTPATQEAVGAPGQPYTATMRTPRLASCDGGEIAVERVDVEIIKPGGDTAPGMAKVLPLNNLTESADVSFIPIEPGQYEVIARFEPNIGVAQTLVNVAFDRRHATASFFATSLRCDLVSSAAGVLLCQTHNPVSHVLQTVVHGVVEDAFPIQAFSRVGDEIWVLSGSPSVVTRYTVDALGVLNETEQSLPLDSAYLFIVAWEDGALLAGQTSITRVALDAGLITPATEWFNNAGTGAYLEVTPGAGAVAISESGGPVWTVDFRNRDAGGLDNGGPSMGQAIGSDGVGIWSMTTKLLQVTRFRPDGNLETASLASSTPAALDSTSPARAPPLGAPILASSTGTVLPRLTDAGIVLDLFPIIAQDSILGADSTCLYEAVDGGVRCWAR